MEGRRISVLYKTIHGCILFVLQIADYRNGVVVARYPGVTRR